MPACRQIDAAVFSAWQNGPAVLGLTRFKTWILFKARAAFYVACLIWPIWLSPKLTDRARSTRSIALLSRRPMRSFRRCLSSVRTCSRRTMESFARPVVSALRTICVGRLAFECWLVIAAAMTVGLKRLPISFWIISTGRMPPCSEPTTGLKSA